MALTSLNNFSVLSVTFPWKGIQYSVYLNHEKTFDEDLQIFKEVSKLEFFAGENTVLLEKIRMEGCTSTYNINGKGVGSHEWDSKQCKDFLGDWMLLVSTNYRQEFIDPINSFMRVFHHYFGDTSFQMFMKDAINYSSRENPSSRKEDPAHVPEDQEFEDFSKEDIVVREVAEKSSNGATAPADTNNPKKNVKQTAEAKDNPSVMAGSGTRFPEYQPFLGQESERCIPDEETSRKKQKKKKCFCFPCCIIL